MNLLQDRDAFRNSQEWHKFKEDLKQTQTLDFVTKQPLDEHCHCHHLDLNFEHYSVLNPSNFVLLNEDTHKKIHDICTIDWKNNLQKYKGTVSDQEYKRMEELVYKMVRISSPEALFLFSYVIDYDAFDPSNDDDIAALAKKYNMPVAPSRNGKADQIQWKCDSTDAQNANLGEFPINTEEYLYDVMGRNYTPLDVNDIYTIAQLRHIGLRNSYKQINRLIDKNPNNNNLIDIKSKLEKEIPTTTKCVKQLKEILNNI